MPSRSRNQTLSFLKRRLAEVGVEPYTRHGQNFLIDLNLQRLLVESAELTGRDVVLEVGTGTGALTVLMAERAAAVVSVEIDAALHQLASEELFQHGAENVTLLQTDALANKNRFSDDVVRAVEERLAEAADRRFKLVANLPYNIATPVLSNLLTWRRAPALMVGTIQKELADRIVAEPRSKDYGALSIWVQSQCRAEIVRTMPPSVFWPRPKVTSAIVRVELDPDRRARIEDLEFFHEFARAIFFHRRKLLRANVLSALKRKLGKEQLDAIMARLVLPPTARAEELDVPTTLALCDAVRREVGSVKIL